MRLRRRFTLSVPLALLALPVLALASVRAAVGASAGFESSTTCGDGPGPICYVEYTCVEWGLRLYPTFPPTDMLVCERWAVTDVRHWTEGGDGGDGETDGEGTPVAPEEGTEAPG